MKKLVCVLAAILIAGSAAAETYRCTVDEGETVNVRYKPSSKSSTGGRRLYHGSTIDGDMTEDGKWICWTDDDGDPAYVMSKYMEIAYSARCTVAANGRVRWRKTPGGKTGGYYQPDDTVYVNGIRWDKDGTPWARTSDGTTTKDKYVSLEYLVNGEGVLLSELY